jgi:hypothetical protein
MRSTHLVRLCAPLLGFALLAGPARTAEPDKYLPDDANLAMTLNLRDLLEAPLVKDNAPDVVARHGLDAFDLLCEKMPGFKELYGDHRALFRKGFEDRDSTRELLSLAGKHVTSYGAAGSTEGGEDHILILIRGDFDADDVKSYLQLSSRLFGFPLKTGALGDRDLFELSLPGLPDPMYGLVPEKGVMILTPLKDYAVEAADKADGKKKPALNKAFRTALEKTDVKQTAWICAVGPAGDPVKSLSGGVSVGKDVQFVLTTETDGVGTARLLAGGMNAAAQEFKDGLKNLARDYKFMAPLADAVKPLSARAAGSTVTMRLTISEATLNKMLK